MMALRARGYGRGPGTPPGPDSIMSRNCPVLVAARAQCGHYAVLVSGYEFDLFISYRRRGNPLNWVHNHFFPRLRDYLEDHLDKDPALFVDVDMEKGTHWPTRLENALSRTKILVPIYSPQYFRSPWCLAEWRTMAERELLLGLSSAERPQGLIYPILFSDSDNFPDFARLRSWRDLKKWNNPDPVFQQTIEWVSFLREVETIAMDLANLLPQVPDWQPDWPVYRPDPPLPPPTRVPRF
jgi:hypothetical protein